MKLKVGDKVKILDGRDIPSKFVAWYSDWDILIGSTSYITRIVRVSDKDIYYFLHNDTRYKAALSYRWLEKVR